MLKGHMLIEILTDFVKSLPNREFSERLTDDIENTIRSEHAELSDMSLQACLMILILRLARTNQQRKELK